MKTVKGSEMKLFLANVSFTGMYTVSWLPVNVMGTYIYSVD